MKKILQNKFIIFVITLVLFFISSLFQLIPIYIFKLDINSLTEYQKILLTIFSSTVTAAILIFIYHKDLKKDWIDFKKNKSLILNDAFQIWVLGLVIMAVSNIIINKFSPNIIANNEKSIRQMISAAPYFMLINTAILAPIVEELVFREAFRKAFKNDVLFVLLSGIIFGSLHVITSIKNVYDYLYLIPYCSLGLSFSYMHYKTKNIYAPLTMHIVHNTIMTILNIISIGMILWG